MDFLELFNRATKVTFAEPWILKWAPTSLDQVVGNDKIISAMQFYLANQNIPNMILTGPNGVGKQTAIRLLLKGYLGNAVSTGSLTIYGSIHRSKDVVSEKLEQKKADKSYDGPNIMSFAKKCIKLPNDACKIIVIYDFDHMTREAQMALRRVIELHSTKIRFIFTANHLEDIIEAIQSRSVILKFTIPCDADIRSVIERVAEAEQVTVTDDVINAICLASNGDIKQAINCLQILRHSDNLSLESFYRIFNLPPIDSIHKIIKACLQNQPSEAYNLVNKMLANGYNVSDLLDIILRVVSMNDFSKLEIKSNNLTVDGHLIDSVQVAITNIISQTFYLTEVASSTIHLYALVAHLGKILASKPGTTTVTTVTTVTK
jgi:replication factor C subunit 2/4